MEKAVILSAGKGSRLLPLTAKRPKCLIELSGRSLLEWQLDALQGAGIRDIVVVTGFGDDLVEAVVAARTGARTLFNPFYHVADNLGSVWMARSEFTAETLIRGEEWQEVDFPQDVEQAKALTARWATRS
jgi:choline kinase